MDRKKKCRLIFCLLCMTFALSACGNKEPKLAEDVFLKVSLTAKGQSVETYEMYTLNLEIHQDGTIRCYADEFNRWLSQEECPVWTMQVTQEEITELQTRMEAADLYHMRERISSPDSKEGEYKSLTVYTAEGEHTTGGLNPSSQDFLMVYDYVENLTREMVFGYRTKISEMQKKGLSFRQTKGVLITDTQENEIVTNESINDVYVTFGDMHEQYVATDTDGTDGINGIDETEEAILYYVTIRLSDDMAERMEGDTAGCTPDLPEYYKLYENQTYVFTFGVQEQIKNGEMYVYETADAAEAESMAKQFRSSVYD